MKEVIMTISDEYIPVIYRIMRIRECYKRVKMFDKFVLFMRELDDHSLNETK